MDKYIYKINHHDNLGSKIFLRDLDPMLVEKTKYDARCATNNIRIFCSSCQK